MNRLSRVGMSLTELVVVLFILAILATVMVVSLETTVEQTRYDQTRRMLTNLEEAVIGSRDQPERPCFLADIGRLPLGVGADPETQLAELWSNPAGLQAFGMKTSVTDLEVRILGGWRGPYFHLPPQPVGSSRLVDGWGNPFVLLSGAGMPLLAGEEVRAIRSPGPAPYGSVPLDLPNAFIPGLIEGQITGAIQDSDPSTSGTGDITVRIYYADASAGASFVREVTVTAPAPGYSFVSPAFTPLPIGPKAIRAYQGARKSNILYLHMPSGGLTLTQSQRLSLDIQ